MCLTVNIFTYVMPDREVILHGTEKISLFNMEDVEFWFFFWLAHSKMSHFGKKLRDPPTSVHAFPVSTKQSVNLIAQALFYDVSLKDLQKIWIESIEITSVQVGCPTCGYEPLW